MSPGSKPNAPAQAMPSQTDLLMALATMYKDGRFDQGFGDKLGNAGSPLSKNIEDRRGEARPDWKPALQAQADDADVRAGGLKEMNKAK